MADLQSFVSDATSLDAVKREPVKHKRLPKGKYIACAFVPKNTLPDIGSSATVTLPGGGAATAITRANIVSALITLALNGQCWFFGNGVINGKRAKPTEMLESAVFGTNTEARPTGEVKEKVDVDYKYFNMNREFFNKLRKNDEEFDIYLFTDKTVECIRFDNDEPIFKEIGDQHTGDVATDVVGSYSIIYSREGQLEPVFGDFERALASSNVRFTFGTATQTAGLTIVAGTPASSPLTVTMVGGTGGTLTRTVTAGSALTYAIFTSAGEAIPAAQPVTINSTTGVITVGNTAFAAGRYRYKVIASNTTGVIGEYELEIRVS